MTEAATTRDVPIMRDNTFARATADNAVVLDLGRDVEIAFMAVSPTPVTNRLTISPGGEERELSAVQIQNSMYEVCRVRMNPDAIELLATQLLVRLIESGESIDDFVAAARRTHSATHKSDGSTAND